MWSAKAVGGGVAGEGMEEGRGRSDNSPAPQNLNPRPYHQPNFDPTALLCHPEAPHESEGRLLLAGRLVIPVRDRSDRYRQHAEPDP
jgi:hypothetical protein